MHESKFGLLWPPDKQSVKPDDIYNYIITMRILADYPDDLEIVMDQWTRAMRQATFTGYTEEEVNHLLNLGFANY